MRSTIALALTTTPALAHTGNAVHWHESHGLWLAAAAFLTATALTLFAALRKPLKVDA